MTKRTKVIFSLVGFLLVIIVGFFVFGVISGKLGSLADMFRTQQICDAPPSQPAFPGCEGYGCNATGWRGGEVIYVTNLDDYNPEWPYNEFIPGSLRAALEAEGPRIIVFAVSGTIDLSQTKNLKIFKPNIYIAGQTAPGDGITIKGGQIGISPTWNSTPHNVVIRYLRVRPGDLRDVYDCDVDADHDAAQVISIGGNDEHPIHDIVLDHTSASWGADEMIQLYADNLKNVTYSWSISSEGFYPCGGRGLLVSNYLPEESPKSKRAPNYISVHHNLFAHSDGRNPKFAGRGTLNEVETYDVRNNVTYNPGSAIQLQGSANINLIGNYVIAGYNTPGWVYGAHIKRDPGDNSIPTVYVYDNIGPGRPTGNEDEWDITYDYQSHPVSEAYRSFEEFDVSPVTTHSAEQAKDLVLANAGAILPKRDTADERIVNDVLNGTGRFIENQDEVGGWPEMNSEIAPTDDDHDGMPNQWELDQGLNPNDASDSAGDQDCDGWTNIEEYISSITSEDTDAPIISNIQTSNIKQTESTITFSTSELTTAEINYGTTTNYGNKITIDDSGLNHSINLTGLTPSTTYHYRITAIDANSNRTISPDQTFTTLDQVPGAPVISNFQATNITQTSATISFDTDVPTRARLDYGTTTNYGSQKTQDNYLTSHSFNFTGLTPAARYFIKITATNQSDISSEYTNSFITPGSPPPPPPEFDNPKITYGPFLSEIKNTSMVVSWVTDQFSTTKIQYGTTNELKQTKTDNNLVKNHSILIQSLTPATQYRFKVTSKNSSNKETSSPNLSLTTKKNNNKFPPETLIKAVGTPNTNKYIVYYGNRHLFNIGRNTFFHCGFKNKNLNIIAKYEMKKVPKKGPINRLWKAPTSKRVYYCSYSNKHYITSPYVFERLGLRWSNVSTILQSMINKLPKNMPLYNIRTSNATPRVFLIFKNYKRWIYSSSIFSHLGFKSHEIKTIPRSVLKLKPTRKPALRNLLQPQHSTKVFLILNQTRHHIKNPYILSRYGLILKNTIKVPDAMLRLYAVGKAF